MKQDKTIFILGRSTALSTAEILAKYGNKASSFEVSKEVMLAVGLDPLSTKIEDLGGTIKVASVIRKIDSNNYDIGKVIKFIIDEISSYSESKNGKFHFGISVYDLDGSKKNVNRLAKSINYLYINTKKEAKKQGIKLAFLRTKTQALSSAAVLKNKLVSESGAEILIVVSKDTIYFCKTVGIQNIDEYSWLDVGRPARDMVSGTTPPKLAKIMINMAGKTKGSTFMDPFCGSGTFIQEMKLAGYKKIYGSDISEKAISDTKLNLAWLSDKKNLDISNIDINVSDANKLLDFIKPKSVDAIVSEVYLGPPQKNILSSEEANSLKNELSSIYNEIFIELSKTVKEDGTIVLALPAFKTKNNYEILSIENSLNEAGLKIVDPNNDIMPNQLLNKSYTSRKTILYSRPDQFVAREIVVLKFNK